MSCCNTRTATWLLLLDTPKGLGLIARMTATMHRRRYADVAIGEIAPREPAIFRITDDVVDAFCRATGDTSPRYAKIRGKPRIAPPQIAAAYIIEVQQARGGPAGGVHAKQKFHFHRAPIVGDVLSTQGTIVDKYEKNGRKYFVTKTVTQDVKGELVAEGLITSIWGREGP